MKTFSRTRIRVSFTPRVDIRDPGMYVGFLTLENERLAGLDFKDFRSVAPIRAGQRAWFSGRCTHTRPPASLLALRLKAEAAFRD